MQWKQDFDEYIAMLAMFTNSNNQSLTYFSRLINSCIVLCESLANKVRFVISLLVIINQDS